MAGSPHCGDPRYLIKRNMKKYGFIALLLAALSFVGCAPKVDIKIISYNIRFSGGPDGDNSWQYRKQASVNMMHEEVPTVMGCQEMLPDQIAFLLDAMPNYQAIGVGRDDGVSAGEHMAILYNTDQVELLEWDTFWLSESPEVPSYGWDAACKRTCTYARFRDLKYEKEFVMLNTHLDHIGKEAKREGAALVARRSLELIPEGVPVFLTGDMNMLPDNESLGSLRAALNDAREVAPKSDHRTTFNGWGNDHRILDYIFLRNAKATEFRVLRDTDYGAPYISDHYPVALTATY